MRLQESGTAKAENGNGMANRPKTITTNSSNANNNNNKKETPKKKKRSPTGKLAGTYSPNSEPLALNNNNNNANNNNNSDSGGSTLKSVVVTLTTPIATTTITISNVNLNNNNISPLEKQVIDCMLYLVCSVCYDYVLSFQKSSTL